MMGYMPNTVDDLIKLCHEQASARSLIFVVYLMWNSVVFRFIKQLECSERIVDSTFDMHYFDFVNCTAKQLLEQKILPMVKELEHACNA